MIIKDFVNAYKAKKFMNTKQGMDEKSEWLRKELEIKPYIPFMEKRQIAEMIVAQNIKEVDGVKRYDNIGAYLSFVMASIVAHTSLECSNNPISDYDCLAESGLLPQIVAEFQESHNEIDILLKMALEMELSDNNVNALVGRFLNKISGILDGVMEAAKEKFGNFDLKDILGADFKEEDLAQLMGLLDKIK